MASIEIGNEIKFTSITVGFNEGSKLSNCLKSVRFCDQSIYIDLGSNDNSLSIAKRIGAEIIEHEWVPIADEIAQKALSWARNNWIIFIDPDEVLGPKIQNEIVKIIKQTPKVGLIKIPWRFYFKNDHLDYSIWGQKKYKGVVFHKDRLIISPYVHQSSSLHPGFTELELNWDEGLYLDHYWNDSYRQFLKKHIKYLKLEGIGRYRSGQRFSKKKIITDPIRELKNNLFLYRGLKNGFRGIFLSFFYSFYIFGSMISLLIYEITQSHGKQ